ncbi:uncharacterized protein [Sinocyclocheilus grahami]|uniref:uncharacterized protein n=1 Tax=Sinocyclocheilus grahami TaxID=75366 RepID=UPI0007AD6580|nr:PREDICTED: uncharacterized protein LOC107568747 [Sinocyclocheilus grahami]
MEEEEQANEEEEFKSEEEEEQANKGEEKSDKCTQVKDTVSNKQLKSKTSTDKRRGAIYHTYKPGDQLNHVKGDGAAGPIWIPVRGTSQQEGFNFHQAQRETGNRVSPELFQAQGMTGVARWNYQRLVDLKQPGVVLPGEFDPVLMMELNRASIRVTGQPKYPALHISSRDTGERFGLQYVEPGCRPVPLDFDKHKSRKTDLGDVEMQEKSSSGVPFSFPSQECLKDTSSAKTPLAAELEATPQTVIFHQFSTPSAVTSEGTNNWAMSNEKCH